MRLVIWDAIARIMTSPWWIRMTGSLWGNLPTDFLNCLESPAIRQLVQQIVLSSKKETTNFLIAGPLWGVIHRWPVVSPLNWPLISKAICDFMSWRHHRTSIANGPFRAIHQCNFNIIKRCSAICQHEQTLTRRVRVTHLCSSELCHHWFKQWFVACSVQCHYLNQWWLLVIWTLRNKVSMNFS